MSDDDINAKYQKGEVRIVTEQARYPLNTITSLVNSGDYILTPEFQRRHRWSVQKQSRLIESFIMNVPIPPVFLYEYDYSHYEVMDGLQRMTAIVEFYNDKYPLQGLEYWIELEGRTYSQLPNKVKQGIDRRYLSSIILLKETAKSKEEADKLKQLVFERINSGGVKLEDQESRNALYPSNFNKLIIKLARNKYFCTIFDIPIPTERENIIANQLDQELVDNPAFSKMKDVEQVLRFFAMRHVDSYEGMPLRLFLDKFSEAAMNLSDNVLNHYESLFNDTIELAYKIYKDRTFAIWKKGANEEWIWKNRPTNLVYDPMMYVLSTLLDKKVSLLAKREDIIQRTRDCMQSHDALFNGRNTTKSYILQRIALFERMFENILK